MISFEKVEPAFSMDFLVAFKNATQIFFGEEADER